MCIGLNEPLKIPIFIYSYSYTTLQRTSLQRTPGSPSIEIVTTEIRNIEILERGSPCCIYNTPTTREQTNKTLLIINKALFSFGLFFLLGANWLYTPPRCFIRSRIERLLSMLPLWLSPGHRSQSRYRTSVQSPVRIRLSPRGSLSLREHLFRAPPSVCAIPPLKVAE